MSLFAHEALIILPDIGTFFNRNMSLAHALVDQVAASGAGWLKGEILHRADIALPGDALEQYWDPAAQEFRQENYRALIERKVVPLEAYAELFDHARAQGLRLCLSVYDEQGVDFACTQGAEILKIASSNITHQPLIEYIARQQRPIILDTGHSTLEEIARAVNWIEDVNSEADLLIEHSPPAPPRPVEEQNLRFMETLAKAFGYPVGLSDHHGDDLMLYGAVALGATVVEKGVMPDALPVDQDVAHALPISQLSDVVIRLRQLRAALGDGYRHLNRAREKYRSRMGVIARESLHPGMRIDHKVVDFAFPVVKGGVGVEHWDLIENARVRQPVETGQPLRWSDLDVQPD